MKARRETNSGHRY